MLAKALKVVHKLEYGDDISLIEAIVDEEIAKANGDTAATAVIEKGMLGILNAKDSTQNAKDYACRKLKLVGSSNSIETLSKMLLDEKTSHMARYALQAMPTDAASKALLDALPKANGATKAGIIGSLGVRQENGAVASLAALLADDDAEVAQAAALALGAIRTKDAGKALASAKPNSEAVTAAIDASLACAESILSSGDKATALGIYKQLVKGDQPKHVKLAATRGMLACAGK